jgi:spermidine/putrescine transport system ATP-binding protein
MMPVGAPASFVVAADRIAMSMADASPNADQAADPGTVIGMKFVGSTQTVFVEVPGAGEFRVQKQKHESKRWT